MSGCESSAQIPTIDLAAWRGGDHSVAGRIDTACSRTGSC
jgi:hypothetical protein